MKNNPGSKLLRLIDLRCARLTSGKEDRGVKFVSENRIKGAGEKERWSRLRLENVCRKVSCAR